MENLEKCHRQGDILFVPCHTDEIAPDVVEKRDGVIAEGEVTGHHHRLASLKKAALFVSGLTKALYVRVFAPEGADIVHEEHGTIHLPQGDYKVNQAREHDYLSDTERQVAD